MEQKVARGVGADETQGEGQRTAKGRSVHTHRSHEKTRHSLSLVGVPVTNDFSS